MNLTDLRLDPIPESRVKTFGRRGTYRTSLGGVGLGYSIDDVEVVRVVRSGGNGFYYDVDGVVHFEADDGAGYMTYVRKMLTGK